MDFINALEDRRHLSAGAVDPSFPPGVERGLGALGAICVERDGRTIIAVEGNLGEYHNAEIERLLANGQVDKSFGVAGVATLLEFSGHQPYEVDAITTDSANRILVAGKNFSGGSFVARLNHGGSPDDSFGRRGYLAVDFNPLQILFGTRGNVLLGGASSSTPGQLRITQLSSRGILDKHFGVAGSITTQFNDLGQGTSPVSFYVLPDGRILAGGLQQGPVDANFYTPERVAISRYLADGSLDRSFGIEGIEVTTTRLSLGSETAEVSYGKDGSFFVTFDALAATSSPVPSIIQPPLVMHFLADGLLDTAYGVDGAVSISAAPAGIFHTFAAPGGDLVLSTGPSFTQWLKPDGTLDETYATSALSPLLTPYHIVQQPNGQLLALMSTNDLGTATYDGLLRYDLTGQLDQTFGYEGLVVDPRGISGAANAMTVQKDRKILIAGSELAPASDLPTSAVLARYTASGQLDTTFGEAGRACVRLGNNASFSQVSVMSNGDILVAASGDDSQSGGSGSVRIGALFEFHPNGSLNRRFGVNGEIVVPDPIAVMAILMKGDEILTASNLLDQYGQPSSARVRGYLRTGKANMSFGEAGQVDLTQPNAASEVESVFVQPDGKVLLGGAIGDDGYHVVDLWITRLNSSGAVDSFFGTAGEVRTHILEGGQTILAAAAAMTLMPSGEILAAGGTQSIVRYLPDGKPDPAFGNSGVMVLPAAIASDSLGGINSVALTARGDILIGVSNLGGGYGAYSDGGVIRITNEQIDQAFGNQGLVSLVFGLPGSGVPVVPDIFIASKTQAIVLANAPSSDFFDVPSGLYRVSL